MFEVTVRGPALMSGMDDLEARSPVYAVYMPGVLDCSKRIN